MTDKPSRSLYTPIEKAYYIALLHESAFDTGKPVYKDIEHITGIPYSTLYFWYQDANDNPDKYPQLSNQQLQDIEQTIWTRTKRHVSRRLQNAILKAAETSEKLASDIDNQRSFRDNAVGIGVLMEKTGNIHGDTLGKVKVDHEHKILNMVELPAKSERLRDISDQVTVKVSSESLELKPES